MFSGGLCLFTIASLDPHYSRLYPTPEIVTVNTADKAESDLIRTPSFSCCNCVGDRKVPGFGFNISIYVLDGGKKE